MTPEERERMNVLSLGIQEERNYEKFADMLREMGELIARKEQRRFAEHPRVVWQRDRPSRTVPGVVSKILNPTFFQETEKVEISVSAADDLFREIRIENKLTNVDGEPVALKNGARVDVTFEANLSETIALEKSARHVAAASPKSAA
jgi:predicted DNA-binding antitoxin AbrB/MazE fold protein